VKAASTEAVSEKYMTMVGVFSVCTSWRTCSMAAAPSMAEASTAIAPIAA